MTVPHHYATRLAALAIGLILALGGCGGGDDDGDSGAPATGGDPLAREADQREGTKTKKDSTEEKSRKDEDDDRSKRPPRSTEETLGRLKPELRNRIIRDFAKIVLKAFDLQGSRVTVSASGRVVSVVLARKDACKARPDEAKRILAALRQSVEWPRTVKVSVAGSPQPLGAYVAANCAKRTLPGGRGRVVLVKSGSNLFQTKPFKITSKTWSVEYVNSGSYFQIFALGSRPQTFSTKKARSGTKRFKGPGTFRLHISGSRDWTVRVRDGS